MLKRRIINAALALSLAAALIPSFGTNKAAGSANAQGAVTIPEVNIAAKNIPDTAAMNFVKNMAVGWNLGNTLDAHDSKAVPGADNMYIETSWVKVKTTKAMIDKVKEAGFQTIRIPVSWHNHVSGDDFTINPAWINRVQEIVDYAVDNDMYIILNIHHDNEEGWIYPDSENLSFSAGYVDAVWTQVAERFKDYGDKLVFETLNEPRLVGHNNEWWIPDSNYKCNQSKHSGGCTCYNDVIESIGCINMLNQTAVDAIRSTGGNNAGRYIMVPGYCASPEGIMHNNFVMPNDTANDKLIASVHAYRPYNFALAGLTDPNATPNFRIGSNDTKEIDDLMDSLYNKLVANNIPVVIGEFGAMGRNGNVQARTDFATYYIAAARARNITCVWWDNNLFTSGETFGILDRGSVTWPTPEIVSGLIKYSGSSGIVKPPPVIKTERIEGAVSGNTVTFPEAIGDKLELDIENTGNVSNIMGGLCFNNINLDGVNYWVGINWYGPTGVVVDFNSEANEVGASLAGDPVTDPETLAKLRELIKKEKSFEFQVWWGTDSSGKELPSPQAQFISLKGAALLRETVEEDAAYGDANADGKIDIGDVIKVRNYVLSPSTVEGADGYISPQGLINANVAERNTTGVNVTDALAIQRSLVGGSLPLND